MDNLKYDYLKVKQLNNGSLLSSVLKQAPYEIIDNTDDAEPQ